VVRRAKKMPRAHVGATQPDLQVLHRCSLRASQGPLKGVNQGTCVLYLRHATLSRDPEQSRRTGRAAATGCPLDRVTAASGFHGGSPCAIGSSLKALAIYREVVAVLDAPTMSRWIFMAAAQRAHNTACHHGPTRACSQRVASGARRSSDPYNKGRKPLTHLQRRATLSSLAGPR
jgi:hypothetical protein